MIARRLGTEYVADCAEGSRITILKMENGDDAILECSPTTAPRIFYRDGRIEPLVLHIPDIFGDTEMAGRAEIVAPAASGEAVQTQLVPQRQV